MATKTGSSKQEGKKKRSVQCHLHWDIFPPKLQDLSPHKLTLGKISSNKFYKFGCNTDVGIPLGNSETCKKITYPYYLFHMFSFIRNFGFNESKILIIKKLSLNTGKKSL